METMDESISKRHHEEDSEDCNYDVLDKEALVKILREKDKLLKEKRQYILKLKKELRNLNENNISLCEELQEIRREFLEYKEKNDEERRMEATSKEEEGEKPMPIWTDPDGSSVLISSIGDVIRATAEAEMNIIDGVQTEETAEAEADNTNSEYVYDSSSGYYYHPSTGYYWDPNSGLFYDYSSGTFYQYNEAKGEYEIHSQADNQSKSISSEDIKIDSQQSSTIPKPTRVKNQPAAKRKTVSKKKTKEKNGRKTKKAVLAEKVQFTKERHRSGSEEDSSDSLATDESELVSDPESGEIISSSSSDVEVMGEEVCIESIEDAATFQGQEQQYTEAMAENYPPCIRAVVEQSEKLCKGTLFIITCAGGTIGRDTTAKHTIEIPDISISKVHARIDYDYHDCCYKVTDLGSQNGTRLNGMRLRQSKAEDSRHPLGHEDILQVGSSTKLLLHIHKGYETCLDCEPGQIQAKLKESNPVKNNYVVLTKEERKQQQRKELKKIKKKYGLQNSHFENNSVLPEDPDYTDKAYLRRKFIGSENETTRTDSPASVYSPISSSNKGHKLLAKMGWKEGQGLGKANAGRAEPINVELRVNQNAGLGSQAGISLSLDRVQDSNKAKRWSQAQKRFNQLQPSSNQSQSSKDSSVQVSSSYYSLSPQKVSADSSNGTNSELNVPLSLPLSSCSSSSSLNSSLKKCVSKPKILWHSGGTENLSNDLSDNKDS